jgi:[ribosomal protein S18]-alanine N-acetyltransferase
MIPHLFNPATEDFALLAGLHAGSFPDAWSATFIRDLLVAPGVFAFVGPGGFILGRAAGGEAEILTLAVNPPARRQGLARALIRAAASHAQDLGAGTLFLEVATGNQAARALYVGLGFSAIGERKAYYGAENALVLKASLPLANPVPNPGDFA